MVMLQIGNEQRGCKIFTGKMLQNYANKMQSSKHYLVKIGIEHYILNSGAKMKDTEYI